MATERKQNEKESLEPLMIRGDRLLLALDALRGIFEPVPGIDPKRTRKAIASLLGREPDCDLSGIVYVACQIDHDGTLRKVLRSCRSHGSGGSRPGLQRVEFDVSVFLPDDATSIDHRHALEHLEVFFLTVAGGDFTEATFRPEGGA